MTALTPPPLRSPIDKGLCHPDWQRWFASLSGDSTTFVTNFANPSAQVGLTAVNGVALTAMRSDAAPPLNVGISPTWTGTHTFTHTIVGNISGNAATATLAATVTTNANLTGPITSVGNATSIASQTGTGTTFAMSAGPTFTGTVNVADLTASGLITASASGISLPSSVYGIVHIDGGTPYNIIQYAGGTGTGSLYIGDFNFFDYVRYYVGTTGSAIHDFKVGSTSYFQIGASLIEAIPDVRMHAGLTVDDLSGVGDRMVVADASGVLSTQAIPGAASYGNPTAMVGLTAVNGSASSALRSDGAPALDQGISPFWTGSHQFQNLVYFGETVSDYCPYIVGSVAFNILTVFAPFDDGGEGSGTGTVSINDMLYADGQAQEIQCFASVIGSPSIDLGKTSQKWGDIWYSGTLHGGGASFSSTITASISGNAVTATALQTARTINTVSFDGTANIVVTAAAGTLTGTTLNSTIVTSSLTSVGTLTSLACGDADFTGNVGILSANTSGARALRIAGTTLTGDNQIGALISPTWSSGSTTTATVLELQFVTAASAFTVANGYGIHINAPSIGAGSAVTTNYAIKIENYGGTQYALHTGSGLVHFGDAVDMSSTLAVTGNISNSSGIFLDNQTGKPAYVVGSAGSNYAYFGNVNSTTWALGYTATNTALGTSALTWTDSGVVAVPGKFSVTGIAAFGAATSTDTAVLVRSTGLTSATSYGINCAPTFQVGVTTGNVGYFEVRTQASGSLTVTTATALKIGSPTVGAGSAITNLYGLDIADQIAGTTINGALRTGLGAVLFGGAVTCNSSVGIVGAFGCNNKSPQTAVTANATVAGGTGTAAGGFDTAANRNAFIALVNQIRSTLIANGIMA